MEMAHGQEQLRDAIAQAAHSEDDEGQRGRGQRLEQDEEARPNQQHRYHEHPPSERSHTALRDEPEELAESGKDKQEAQDIHQEGHKGGGHQHEQYAQQDAAKTHEGKDAALEGALAAGAGIRGDGLREAQDDEYCAHKLDDDGGHGQRVRDEQHADAYCTGGTKESTKKNPHIVWFYDARMRLSEGNEACFMCRARAASHTFCMQN